MGRVEKLFNADYLHDVPITRKEVNEHNRAYIERFVIENYERLLTKFARMGDIVNSNGYGPLDKLNETILSLYTDPELSFNNWSEAERYMLGKFTDKAIRIPMKKPIKTPEE